MPRMQFSTIKSRIEEITNIKNKDDLIKEGIQWGLDQLTDTDLPYLMDEHFFTTVAPYTTGTVDATNGSKTISGTGTTFTASMVGRKIRIDSQQAYYRIAAFVGATEITLETTYQGDTVTGKTFSIYKDEYKLRADVDRYKLLRQVEDSVALGSIHATAFDIYDPTPSGEGTIRFEILTGTRLDEYSTGTVTGSVNSSVITGSSTAWTSVEGLTRGSRMKIGENVYTVKSIESDTQLTLYDKLLVAASSDSYVIHLDNILILVSNIPDSAQNVYYRYQRVPFPLINDTDIPDLPEKYHHLLVRYGLSYAWMSKDKEEASKQFLIAKTGREEMWGYIGHLSRSRRYKRRSMDRGMESGRSGQPKPPSNYGVPIEL